MLTTTLDASQILGVTQRQVQLAVQNGLLTAVRLGRTLGVYEHQVFALERMDVSGRRWDDSTWTAALDLLSTGKTKDLGGSQRSRLKKRLREMGEAELIGRVLAGRVTLYRATNEQLHSLGSVINHETDLVGYGTAVIADPSPASQARSLGLVNDPEGNVVAVNASRAHHGVVEALAYIAYGSTREESAGREWLEKHLSKTVGR
ncbi:hypothetical protein JOF28_000610 [Leucobacter exalbidus]|uniref:Helix-turn-helix domain-containing protein n=1 Tax=Leucobacter exalbidus TaxID=662960 RepID=A0A940PRE2_9MICO|nr:hypothetical protein [Leucobacter exalbidus]MBP1325378.1 hypothetical protein [Leucobacter exalbidus]